VAAWQEVARRLAHEIKNPLTPIQMAMDTLRKTWPHQAPQVRRGARGVDLDVLEEADRLSASSRVQRVRAHCPSRPSGRPTSARWWRARSRSTRARRSNAKLADALPSIEADRGQLTQVLLNLLENARDAIGTRDGGASSSPRATPAIGSSWWSRTTARRAGRHQGRMFHALLHDQAGQGRHRLGLAIAHRIVTDHGGRISVSDAPGGGARFVVEMPLKQGAPLLASRI